MSAGAAEAELRRLCVVINKYLSEGNARRRVELRAAAMLTGRGRLPRDSEWRQHAIIGGSKFVLGVAVVIRGEVMVVATPESLSSELSHVRIPLKMLAADDFTNFKEPFEEFMEGMDMGQFVELADRARQLEQEERWAAMQQERGDVFGSW